jgi:hypothetical protein
MCQTYESKLDYLKLTVTITIHLVKDTKTSNHKKKPNDNLSVKSLGECEYTVFPKQGLLAKSPMLNG